MHLKTEHRFLVSEQNTMQFANPMMCVLVSCDLDLILLFSLVCPRLMIKQELMLVGLSAARGTWSE
jgi:hypothetical protein